MAVPVFGDLRQRWFCYTARPPPPVILPPRPGLRQALAALCAGLRPAGLRCRLLACCGQVPIAAPGAASHGHVHDDQSAEPSHHPAIQGSPNAHGSASPKGEARRECAGKAERSECRAREDYGWGWAGGVIKPDQAPRGSTTPHHIRGSRSASVSVSDSVSVSASASASASDSASASASVSARVRGRRCRGRGGCAGIGPGVSRPDRTVGCPRARR